MKRIKCILFFMLLCCGSLTCEGGKANVKNTIGNKAASKENKLEELRARAKILFPDMMEYEKISSEYFEKDKDFYIFTMKFSNIIYETSEGKIVKVPIFRGTMGDVLYDDFLKYCTTKKIMEGCIESAFDVKFKKGEYNKVLDEFKKFYGRRLSINFKEMPTEMSPYSEEEQLNTYAFTLDGVDGELSFYYLYPEYIDKAAKLEYVIRVFSK